MQKIKEKEKTKTIRLHATTESWWQTSLFTARVLHFNHQYHIKPSRFFFCRRPNKIIITASISTPYNILIVFFLLLLLVHQKKIVFSVWFMTPRKLLFKTFRSISLTFCIYNILFPPWIFSQRNFVWQTFIFNYDLCVSRKNDFIFCLTLFIFFNYCANSCTLVFTVV